MVESLETLPISDTLHAEGVVAVAQDAVAVAIGWEVEGHEELEIAETSPDVASAWAEDVAGINVATL